MFFMINDLVQRDSIMHYGGKWKIRPISNRQGGGLRICEAIMFMQVFVDDC